jgi:hypothetical protein
MFRRLSAFAVAALIAAQVGCSSRCDSRPGLFSSHKRNSTPCLTVGRTDGCFDAATGQPCPCPPEAGGAVVPGGAFPPAIPGPAPVFPNGGPPSGELHMPSPSDLIRPPGVPPAVPIPAPGDARLPFPASSGVPVKGQNK